MSSMCRFSKKCFIKTDIKSTDTKAAVASKNVSTLATGTNVLRNAELKKNEKDKKSCLVHDEQRSVLSL